MIYADLHTHTLYAHGNNTPKEMYEAGKKRGLMIHGFSEHSPRPLGYDYPSEYREKLAAHFADYVREVRELAEQAPLDGGREVLLGLEMDWLENEIPFQQQVLAGEHFDYVIGGIHFLGTWGFDASAEDWKQLSAEGREECYARYYATMKKMAESGLFDIVAHPDLIKIFTVNEFHAWLEKPDSMSLVRDALRAVKNAGMAMEISSAGLRKPCGEIYPCGKIVEAAAELHVPITFGSDGHCVNTIATGFEELSRHAAAAGYTQSLVFHRREDGSREVRSLSF